MKRPTNLKQTKMKRLINLFVAAFGMLAMAAGFTSCEEDAVEKLTIAGSWKVVKCESFILNPEGGEMDPAEWNVSEYNFVNTFRLDGSFQYGVLRPAVDGVAGEYREDLFRGSKGALEHIKLLLQGWYSDYVIQ